MMEILTYFFIYSFIGWILESVSKSILQKKVINSGFLYGPFCYIYGIGALIMLFAFKPIHNNYVLLFFVSIVVMSTWEVIVGIFLEKVFKTKYWDYSENKFNFKGYICLKNSICWGVLTIAFINFVHPFVEKQLIKIPQNIVFGIISVILLVNVIDTVLTIVKLKKINIKLENLNRISESIKEKLEQIKEMSGKRMTTETLQKVVDELREKQKELKEKVERQTKRLLKVFPNIKSDNFTKYLSERYNNIKEDIKNRTENK